MREQQSSLGRGAMMAVAAIFAVCAVVALSAPQRQELPQAGLASLPAWSAQSAAQQQALKNELTAVTLCTKKTQNARS